MSFQEEQINEEYLNEIQALIIKHPEGLTFIQMFDRLPGIPDQTELSKSLHESFKRKICAKIDGKYHPYGNIRVTCESTNNTGKAPEVVTAEIKTLLENNPETAPVMGTAEPETESVQTPEQHKTVQTKTRRTTFTPMQSVKAGALPFGLLRRKGAAGRIAYALYRIRGEGVMSFADMRMLFPDITNSSMYQAMHSLGDGEVKMVEKDSSDFSKPLFKWSGNYAYPFQRQDPEDKHLVPFKDWEEFQAYRERTLSDITTNTYEKTQTPPTVISSEAIRIIEEKQEESSTVVVKRNDGAKEAVADVVKLLIAKIAFHEAEILTLKAMKEKLDGVIDNGQENDQTRTAALS